MVAKKDRKEGQVQFTDTRVKDYKPSDGKLTYSMWDEDLPGFGFRVQNGGNKVYYAKYRIGGQQRWLKIGAVDKLKGGLTEARNKARAFFSSVASQVDPANVKAKAVAALSTRFNEELIEAFLDQKRTDKASKSYVKRCEATLKRSFKALHGISLNEIDRATVSRELTVIKKRGPVVANRSCSILKTFFNWAIASGVMDSNPADKTVTNKEQHRRRYLSEAELKAVWNKADDEADKRGDYSRIVKLLILTMARKTWIAELDRAEINWKEKHIELSAERTKNNLPLIIPLSAPALAILKMAAKETDGRYIFAKRNNWQIDKDRLDQKLGDIPHWVLHDLRRTGKTYMGKLFKVLPHVSEALLGHKPRGIEAVYNEYDYLDEKREALDKYAAWLMKAVT